MEAAQGVPRVARVSQCLGKNIQAQTSPGTQQGSELVGSGTDKDPRQAKTGRGASSHIPTHTEAPATSS